MAKVFAGVWVRGLTLTVAGMLAFSVLIASLILWIETDKNKDNWYCQDIPNPSDVQRLWIFKCAPNFGNSIEVFGIYFLGFTVFLCTIPLVVLIAVIAKRYINHAIPGDRKKPSRRTHAKN